MHDHDNAPTPYDIGALDRLAGVLSGDLVECYPKTMTDWDACALSERNPDDPVESGEVHVTLWLLVAYGLAEVMPGEHDEWRATLAAVIAERIDF
jgi:hypothetical protein